MDAITYPYWDYNQSILVKGAPDIGVSYEPCEYPFTDLMYDRADSPYSLGRLLPHNQKLQFVNSARKIIFSLRFKSKIECVFVLAQTV